MIPEVSENLAFYYAFWKGIVVVKMHFALSVVVVANVNCERVGVSEEIVVFDFRIFTERATCISASMHWAILSFSFAYHTQLRN